MRYHFENIRVGKKCVVQKMIAGDSVLHEYSKAVRRRCPCLVEANLTHWHHCATVSLLRKWHQRRSLLHLMDCLQLLRQQMFIIDRPIYRSWNGWEIMTACILLNGAVQCKGEKLVTLMTALSQTTYPKWINAIALQDAAQ